ncbi:tRNA lysidine(34) synthetase TilS [Paenibacillus sp. 481]|uniref:tRNA lysidine(34) synthetase TilS n=1 Tax=Paenibacillus sp. 481 TaxID=2835869 RepID=UPI001E60EF50|nr:tRNA lysidine(34) synthetase TilS [Paenibacillus sp. 481]UHA75314.1 tRNA lysidine(34) synthetase TilS [Paenibacillus sp. 481]
MTGTYSPSEYRWRKFIIQLADTAAQHKLWLPGETIVAAVSGGPDSMLLLHALVSMQKMYSEDVGPHTGRHTNIDTSLDTDLLNSSLEIGSSRGKGKGSSKDSGTVGSAGKMNEAGNTCGAGEMPHAAQLPFPRIVVAHVHHGFRGEESDDEAELVAEEAVRLGVPCEMIRVDAPGYAQEHGMNAQAAARTLRFSFLKEVAEKHNATVIALAHHANDQAETILMRMLRGAGSSGLSGIAWKRNEEHIAFVRPLLHLTKAELLRWCKERSITYASDSSNMKRDYFRNRLRLDIIPVLEQENPQLTTSLCRIAETMRADHDWMEHETQKLFQSIVKAISNDKGTESVHSDHGNVGFTLERKALLDVHVALQRRLIKLILNYLLREADQVDYDLIETLRKASLREAPTTWRMHVAEGILFQREYDRLLWLRQDVQPSTGQDPDVRGSTSLTIHRTDIPGDLSIPWSGGVLHMSWLLSKFESESELKSESELVSGYSVAPTNRGNWAISLDADHIRWPLTIRTRQPGDRMRVKGLNGSKKVQDMFVDAKIAPSMRNVVPILTDTDGHIVWVPGVRRSEIALVQPSTRHILHMYMEGGAFAPTS